MIIDIVLYNSLAGNSHKKILCRCDGCSTEKLVPKNKITISKAKDYTYCRKCRGDAGALSRLLSTIKSDKYVGKVVNKLTILEYLGKNNKTRHYFWKCRCECGKEVNIRAEMIQNGRAYSCGCIRRVNENLIKTKTAKGETGFNCLYGKYKHSAEKRGIKFSLSKEEFAYLTSQDCFYCGTKPKQKSKGSHSEVRDSTIEHGMYLYNGIDRKNSDGDYIIDNCLPCCRVCNYAKNDMNYNDFIDWIESLVSFRLNKKEFNLINY